MSTPVAPPASFPGTVKVFTTKDDGDVIYGAAANEWQNEIVAIERTLGVNPQGTYDSVADRLANFGDNAVLTTDVNQLVHGVKTFDNVVVGDSFLSEGTFTVKQPTRQYAFEDAGLQQQITDGSNSPENLVLQPTGGQVFRGGFRMWDAGNDGAGSGLDADLLDGHQAADFLLRSGCRVQLGSDQTVPLNPPNATVDPYWRALGLTTVTYEQYNGDGTKLWDSTNHVFHVDVGIWIVQWYLAWEGHNNGSRGIRGLQSTVPVNASPAAQNFTTYFSEQHYMGLAPNWWPTTGLTTNNVLEAQQNSAIFVADSAFDLRVDVWNYCDADVILHSTSATHLHQASSVSLAQVA